MAYDSVSLTVPPRIQDLLELRSEVGDFLQPRVGGRGSPGAAEPPPVVLAVDATADADDLELLKAALLEVWKQRMPTSQGLL